MKDITYKLEFIIRLNRHKITLFNCFTMPTAHSQFPCSAHSHQAANSPCLEQHRFRERTGYRKVDSSAMPCHPQGGLSPRELPSSSNKLLLSSNLPFLLKETPRHVFLLKRGFNWQFSDWYIFISMDATHTLGIKGALWNHCLYVNRMFSVYCFLKSQQRQMPHITRRRHSLNEDRKSVV